MIDIDKLKSEADSAFREGRLDDARRLYEEVLDAKPDLVAAHNNLAMVLRQLGDDLGAEREFRAALEIEPDQVSAINNLGAFLLEQNKPQESVEYLNHAISINPDYDGAYYNRAKAYGALGNATQEIKDLEHAVELNDTFAEALTDLGRVYRDAGQIDDSERVLRLAIDANPSMPEPRVSLGMTLNKLGRSNEAIVVLESALEFDDQNPKIYYNLGLAYSSKPAHYAAIKAYKSALQFDPAHDAAANNMFGNFVALGRIDEARQTLETALSINPRYTDAASNLLFLEQYDPNSTPQSRYSSARKWQNQNERSLEIERVYENPKNLEKQLNIGFVSPNLNRHPVGYFLLPFLRAYSRERLSLTFYCENRKFDDFTDLIRGAASKWRNIHEIHHDDLRNSIQRDEVDILIDLAGHTGTNRMLVFAKRAPIQVSWAGYVGTTGLDAMDYLITDERQTAPQDLEYMTELPVYMPGNYVVFEPPHYAPLPNEPPISRGPGPTFGSFNSIFKINSRVIELWAKILESIPYSSLRLIISDLGDEDVCKRIEQEFVENGIDSDRLQLEGRKLHNELLSAYQDIDIALDPFPYSGGLTTLEALWMGVPVITRSDSDRFAGRHSVTHLTAAGVPELIANNAEDYVNKAVALAKDTDRLIAYRTFLRDRLAQSPACDGVAFTRHFERACRIMWHRWCNNERPSPINTEDLLSASTEPAAK